MKLVSYNINCFGGTTATREEYKKVYGISNYIREWDSFNKSRYVSGIADEIIKESPDIIVLQEFDLYSKEAKKFIVMMDESGYKLDSEIPELKRPSMTVFFIKKEISYTPLDSVHIKKPLKAFSVLVNNDYIVYGIHVPPKYDEDFWNELETFVNKYNGRKMILVGDLNTINYHNQERIDKLLERNENSPCLIDVLYEKGIGSISIPGDYLIVSDNIPVDAIDIYPVDNMLSDHPMLVASFSQLYPEN